MELILLERIARLGNIGDTVNVKDGYGRNFLIPQGKALRATEGNKQLFEDQKAVLEKRSAEVKADAEALAKKLKGASVKIVRQASEDGRLYGSVNARDVAVALAEAGHKVEKRFVQLNDGIKALGLYQATLSIHAEVKISIDIEVVRTLEASAYDEMAKEDAIEADNASDEEAA